MPSWTWGLAPAHSRCPTQVRREVTNMPARTLALGAGRWLLALVYVVAAGYFMYLVYRISAALQRVAASLEQIRMDNAATKKD